MSTTVRDMAHLVGVAEIREVLGVSRQYVDTLSRRDTFPKPAAELASGRVWQRKDVEARARATERIK